MQNELIAPKLHQCQGKFMYRTCEDIMNGLKTLLNTYNCSLIINDEIISIGDSVFVKATAILFNQKGEKLEASACAKHPDKLMAMSASQITGSTSSYARKFALSGLLCLDDSQDADVIERDKKASGLINSQEKQGLFNMIKSMGIDNKEVSDYLLAVHGFNSSADVTKEKLPVITEAFTKNTFKSDTENAQNANT
jgi:hypothetical protein